MLARGSPFGAGPEVGVGMVLANLSVLLLLGAVLAGRLTRVWVERRRGSAGSRLHVRLVMLFSVVAVAPTIVVAVFATAFFHFGIQAWFNDPVRAALTESLQASRGYLGGTPEQHPRRSPWRWPNDLSARRTAAAADPERLRRSSANQTALRGLTEAVIYEPVTGQVIASAGVFAGLGVEPPPAWATERARTGDVAVVPGADHTRVRAVVPLNSTPPLMLMIGRPIDPQILDHMVQHRERRWRNTSGWTRTAPGCRSPSAGFSRSSRCSCCRRRC